MQVNKKIVNSLKKLASGHVNVSFVRASFFWLPQIEIERDSL